MSTPAKKPRQSKTPAQRAKEALGVAEREVKRLETHKTKLETDLEQVNHDYDSAISRLNHRAADPDLVLGVPDGDAAARRTGTTNPPSTGATW